MQVHKMLEEIGVKHEIAENYLSSDERLKLFDLVSSYRDWYKNKPILNDLEFEGVNLLGLLDTHEFQSYVLPELLNFLRKNLSLNFLKWTHRSLSWSYDYF